MIESVDVVIIGAGQAGLATSHELGAQGIEHVVLERARVGESWRSNRWDSFTLVTPNWTVQLPGFGYQGGDPDGFMGRDEVISHLEAYRASFSPPMRLGTSVTRVEVGDNAFIVETERGKIQAHAVVVATGSYGKPRLPAVSSEVPDRIVQLHSSRYRNPAQLPDGAALVVGTGQSGVQIAEELHEAGRRLFVSVSGCPRLPRRYRGMDIVWWAKTLGLFERTVDTLENPAEKRACHPQGTGRRRGHDIDLRKLAREGVTLAGKVVALADLSFRIAPDLADNMRRADEFAEKTLSQLDQAVAKLPMPLPDDQNRRGLGEPVAAELNPLGELNLELAGITSIVWATGYRPDFSVVRAPVFDHAGEPLHRRGITETPGLYFVGLEWLYKPKSGLLLGVGEDAGHIASAIAARSKSRQTAKEASR